MKTIILKNYIHGLASFLDEKQVKWEQVEPEIIKIYYSTEEELFLLGFEFGKFYEKSFFI